jgi:hypothetical protein
MDQIDESIHPDAGQVNGTHAYGMEESAGAIDPTSTTSDGSRSSDAQNLTPSFLAELANAMKAAADRERGRISGLVSETAAAHVERVRSRAILETEELRRLADQDVQGIEQWSAAEMERVRSEAEQRTNDRRASLEEYLKQHDAIIETEISGVDAAVVEYHATLDRFFAELAETADPSDIVARAEHLPSPPDLDAVRASARASAMSIFAEPEAETAPADDQAMPTDVEATAAPTMDERPTSEATAQAADVADEAATQAVAEPITDGAAESDATADADAQPLAEGVAEPMTVVAAEPEAVAQGDDASAASAESEPETHDEPYRSDRSGWYDVTAQPSNDGWDVGAPAAEPEPAPAVAESEPTPVTAGEETSASDQQGSPEEAPTPVIASLPRPIGVMDPDATTDRGWRAPEPRPVAVTPTVDHTSAAVRLLRSVAPWTAPTQGSDRPTDEE